MVGISLSRGYVFSVLWGWFIVPAFSVPVMGLVTALGISFIMTMVCNHPSEYRKPLDIDKNLVKEIAIEKLMESLMFPWTVLVIILKIAALFV